MKWNRSIAVDIGGLPKHTYIHQIYWFPVTATMGKSLLNKWLKVNLVSQTVVHTPLFISTLALPYSISSLALLGQLSPYCGSTFFFGPFLFEWPEPLMAWTFGNAVYILVNTHMCFSNTGRKNTRCHLVALFETSSHLRKITVILMYLKV